MLPPVDVCPSKGTKTWTHALEWIRIFDPFLFFCIYFYLKEQVFNLSFCLKQRNGCLRFIDKCFLSKRIGAHFDLRANA